MFGFGLVMTFMLLFFVMALVVIGLVAIVQCLDRSTQRKRLSRLQERTRLGQCRKCGYDLAGLGAGEGTAGAAEKRAVCPECGADDD